MKINRGPLARRVENRNGWKMKLKRYPIVSNDISTIAEPPGPFAVYFLTAENRRRFSSDRVASHASIYTFVGSTFRDP